MTDAPSWGTTDKVDELLASYGYQYGPFQNETDALLAALLTEQRALRTGTDPTIRPGEDGTNPNDVGGTFHSEELSVDDTEWTQVEPGFISSELDLRREGNTSNDLLVAFTKNEPSGATPTSEEIVRYRPDDFPIAGLKVSTGNIWLRSHGDANSGAGVDVLLEVVG